MKNHLLFLLILITLTFSGCEKIENTKTLGDLAAGEYKDIAIVLGDTEIPLPLESGDNSLNINPIVQKHPTSQLTFKLYSKKRPMV